MIFRKAKTLVAGAVLAATPFITVLTPSIVHALPTNYCQWNGSVSTAWNTAANWTAVGSGCAGGVPGTGDNLVFGNVAAANDPTNNDISGLSVASIDFEAVDAGQALGGNAFTLTGNVTNNTGTSDNISNNIAVTSASVMSMGSMAAINFSGVISGSGNITVQGTGNVDFVGAITNTGTLTVNTGNGGGVIITAQSSASPTFSGVTVASGAFLGYDAFNYSGAAATYNFSSPITTAGTIDFSTSGSLATSDLNLTGTFTLTGDSTITTSGGETVHIKGALTGPGFTVKQAGQGSVLNESTSNDSATPSGDLVTAATGSGEGSDDGGVNAPDTGFALVSAHPAVTLAVTLAVAGALVGAAQLSRKASARR